jgi:hypothetical protein
MADNIQVTQGTGTTMATDDVAGVQYPRVKISHGVDGTAVDASSTNPLPVAGPLTDAQLRANAVTVTGPLTSAQLTAAALATEATTQSISDRLPSVFQTPNLLAVDSLGTPQVSRVQATTGTAASITLTSTCRRVSMFATQGAWYSISGTATDTSHYVGAGERIDFDVPASTTISVLQETVAGSIRITELL